MLDKGFDDTYAYSATILDYEQYVVLIKELVLTIGLSFLAVTIVVSTITGSMPVTCLVMLSIVLVDLFLLSLIHFWDLTLNNIIVVQLVVGLGLSVDYAAHIAHTYLIVQVPKEITTDAGRRMHKAKVAVSSMGSSVIHGGASTFMAVMVLSGAKSYIFVVFFKMWFGIVVFGMANGFILLPVILSLIGPIPDLNQKNEERTRRLSRRMSSLGPKQLEALKKQAGMVDPEPKDIEMASNVPTSQPSA